MHTWKIEILRCIKCQEKLKSSKISNKFLIASCSCSQYPLVEGILYLYKDSLRKKALKYLKRGELNKAIITLIGERKKLSIPISVLLLPNYFNSLTKKIFNRDVYQILGFERIVNLLTLFSYPKAWAFYIKNRERMPTYLFSLATANILKRNNQKVIDAGCGTGQLLKVLAKKTNPENIYALDQSFLSLLFARRFFASPKSLLVCCDIEKGFPFINKSADLIISADSFHYLKEKGNFIKEVSRVLGNYGVLAALHIINQSKIVFGNVRGITPQKLVKMLHRAGLEKHMFISNTDMWVDIYDNKLINLNRPGSLENLKYTFAYGFFASKKKLNRKIKLTRGEHSMLKNNKIEFSKDKELINELNFRSSTDNYNSFIFLSPHLDDAVFSCSLMMARLLDRKKKMKVITFFTKVSGLPFTPQAKEFLRASGYSDAGKLFKDREKEDIRAVEYFGGEVLHLDFIDAAWRKKNNSPIYESDKDQFAGKIATDDEILIDKIASRIRSLIKTRKNPLVLAPLGVGGHADHLIVREVATRLGYPVLFWEDFPYNIDKDAANKFFAESAGLHNFFSLNIKGFAQKRKAIKFYRSQIQMHFPNGEVPISPEKYYRLNQST